MFISGDRGACPLKRAFGFLPAAAAIVTAAGLVWACARTGKTTVKALILPKFEVGELSGDFPGEAQYYYEEYMDGADSYGIRGGFGTNKLYIKNGVALYVTGMGKVNAAASTAAILADGRFDFSGAYIISTGCAGGAVGRTVMGDVIIASAVADYDLGHHADPKGPDQSPDGGPTWFHDASYDSGAYFLLDAGVVARAYELGSAAKIETTPLTREFMAATFAGQEWAEREPRLIKGGTAISGDNYWKGEWGHKTAELIAGVYGAPDPYMLTEMEDIAIAAVAARCGLLNRYIIIRDTVNMDVFMRGVTPLKLWGPDYTAPPPDAYDELERADIFRTAMKNNFDAGKLIIDAIIAGEF